MFVNTTVIYIINVIEAMTTLMRVAPKEDATSVMGYATMMTTV